MRSTTDAWTDLEDAVLGVFRDSPLGTGDVCRALPDVPERHVRTALHQLAGHELLAAHRGAVHTTYRITEAGKSHLTNAMEVAR